MLKQVIDDFGPKFFSTICRISCRLHWDYPKTFRAETSSPSILAIACVYPERKLPAWRRIGFSIRYPRRRGVITLVFWYNSSQRHPKAVEMYITALFVYFEMLHIFDAISDSEQIEYSLHALGSDTILTTKPWNEIPLRQASVVSVPSYSTLQKELTCQGSNGAVAASANKDIGFGQSATQEKIYVGNCPEACPAVLVTPNLGPDQVLVIAGARPILRIVVQRRAMSWSILEPPPKGR